MRSLSIRSRLTLWYFCAFALAGLLLSLASWFLLQRSLDVLMLHELDERSEDLERFLQSHAPDASWESVQSDLMNEYREKDEGKWLQILDENGHWLYFSSRGAVRDAIPPAPSFASPASAALISFAPMTGHSLRVVSYEVRTNGHSYRISMAMSADRSVLILAQFRLDLLLLVPVVLLSAAVVGHILSRKALAPVAAIVAEVRRINDQNLSTRLPVAQTCDELAQLSETLNQMLQRIDLAFRSVRSLTANSSHELRTPLSLIRTRVEIALCFPRTAEHYRSVLEEVQAETVRMTGLIENLLTLARYDAGAAQPELQPLNITSLASKAVQEWMPTAERLTLQLRLLEGTDAVWVMGNPESLARMLRILLDNACRYTPPGGWIEMSTQTSEGTVTMAVADSGIGVGSDDLPHIFERFYRARTPRHAEQFGSGLGLSLAKWIVDHHKGTITVESTPGIGSCFRVTFPECAVARTTPAEAPVN